MTSPWDDRERFYSAVEYLGETYEKILTQLVKYLNEVHRTSYGPRYWRILIGPWLIHFLHSVYDRYVHLIDAFNKYPSIKTILCDTPVRLAPVDTLGFVEQISLDGYNLQLYSQLLTEMGFDFPVRTLETEDKPVKETKKSLNRAIGRSLRWFDNTMQDCLTKSVYRRSKVGLTDMNFGGGQLLSLVRSSNGLVAPIRFAKKWPFTFPTSNEEQLRNGLSDMVSYDTFGRIFARFLHQHFPSLYLEKFHQARMETLSRFPNIPPVLCSSTGWIYNEQFKFLAAEASERGSRLVAIQHGGGYGTYQSAPFEKHEIDISDSFVAWGWAKKGTSGVRNLSHPKLASLLPDTKKLHNTSERFDLLFISTSHPRYLYRFHSCPVGGQIEDYIDWELRFLAATPESIRESIRFRLYPTDYQWCSHQRIADNFSDVHWDKGGNVYKKIKDSRIVIIDHLSTSILEALTANVPTVLYWDPKRWEVRKEVEHYFEDLRSSSILWDSPESAAEHLKKIYDKPWEWWDSESLQKTRRKFVKSHASAQLDWAKFWTCALEEEVSLSRVQ